MKPCSRVGLDITWRCNWRCTTCFYLRDERFHQASDVPLEIVKEKIDKAHAGGLDHAVYVGYGEPSLCQDVRAITDYSHSRGMSTSMITNGATGLWRFQNLIRSGMDHLHISSHGLGDTLDAVANSKGTFAKQAELKNWLSSEKVPFRTNVTLQKLNYQSLEELAAYEVGMGVFHFVFLGFLPHYAWSSHVNDVAMHPADLRPYMEAGADVLLDHNILVTIRYHPFCHLRSDLWKYVVNARYVLMDNFEWNYSLQIHDPEKIWRDSVHIGESVACKEPCRNCLAYRHCGGWNKVYAAAFGGADLKPILEIPDEYKSVWDQDGGLFDLNPATRMPSRLRETA